MKKWEYLTLYHKVSGLGLEKALNMVGKNGWEVVSVIDDLTGGAHYVLFVLKREISN